MEKLFFTVIAFLLILPTSSGWAAEFCFDEAGRTFTLPPHLLRSIATIESGMNPSARNLNRNGSTDLGLMQVNSSWIGKAGLDKERLLSDACYNTLAGARILRGCIGQHGYTWEAIGCYNAASSDKRKIYAWKVFRQLLNNDRKQQHSPESHAASVSKPIEPRLAHQSGSLTISINEQGEAGSWAMPPGPVASKVTLDQEETTP